MRINHFVFKERLSEHLFSASGEAFELAIAFSCDQLKRGCFTVCTKGAMTLEITGIQLGAGSGVGISTVKFLARSRETSFRSLP